MRRSFVRCVFRLVVLAILFIALLPATVKAKIPDLRGTWTGYNTDPIDQNGNSNPDFCGVRVTFQIDQQRGRHFEGRTICEGRMEKLIGMISSDNKTFYAVDDHRVITGKIRSPSELEIYFQEPTGRIVTFVAAARLDSQ